ncbi:MAG TPA: DUF4140 domain-containing protein, partial [Kofleriaceae bacterium]|nr:DUF4140 domain-containing protein [Kofleriaceae bacterium]
MARKQARAGDEQEPGGERSADGPAVPEPRAVDLPVATVTLLEDRAHVVRRGSVALAGAGERVRVERIAPVASDKTLAVTVVEGSVVVVDARIRRRAVVRLRDPDGDPPDVNAEREALERERDELYRTMAGLRAEREVAARQGAAIDRATALALAELAEDVSWGSPVDAEWSARLD